MATLPQTDPKVETLVTRINRLEREIRLLQERAVRDDVPGQRRNEVTFARHGALVVGEKSGEYLLKDFSATVHRLDITAQVPSSTDATYQVLVNGNVAYTGTLLTNERVCTVMDLAIEVTEYARLAVNWTALTGLQTVVMTFQVVAVEGEEYD